MDESWMPCPAILRALSGRPSQEGIPFSVFSGTLTPLINHVILPLLPTPTPTAILRDQEGRAGGPQWGASQTCSGPLQTSSFPGELLPPSPREGGSTDPSPGARGAGQSPHLRGVVESPEGHLHQDAEHQGKAQEALRAEGSFRPQRAPSSAPPAPRGDLRQPVHWFLSLAPGREADPGMIWTPAHGASGRADPGRLGRASPHPVTWAWGKKPPLLGSWAGGKSVRPLAALVPDGLLRL